MKCNTHKESKKSEKPSDICNTRIDLRASLGVGISTGVQFRFIYKLSCTHSNYGRTQRHLLL